MRETNARLTNATIVADIFLAPSKDRIEFQAKAAASVDGDGRILSVGTHAPEDARHLSEGRYLLPGLVDLHVHAPQFLHMGSALEHPETCPDLLSGHIRAKRGVWHVPYD